MSLKSIVIAVALDGVCADFYGRMREIAAEWLECDLSELTPEPSCSLTEWGLEGGEQYASLSHFAVTRRKLFATCKMIAGSGPYLKKLSDQGARIIIYRYVLHNFHQKVITQTFDWLHKNRICYGDLFFMEEREEVGADIYIESDPYNVVKLRQKGLYTICFANSTNQGFGPPRAETWAEVYELIKGNRELRTGKLISPGSK